MLVWLTDFLAEATWYSLLLLGYKPVQHVTVQNNMRLNQAQGKMMPSRVCVNTRVFETAGGITGHTVYRNFLVSRKNTL